MKGHKKTTVAVARWCASFGTHFPLDVHHVGSISSGQIFLSCERTAPGHGIAMAMGMHICIMEAVSIMKPMEVWFEVWNDLNISTVLLRRNGWMKNRISPTDLTANLQTSSEAVKFS